MVVHDDPFWVMVVVKVVAGRKANVCFLTESEGWKLAKTRSGNAEKSRPECKL